MFTTSVGHIANQPEQPFSMKYPSSMDDGFSQTAIPIMTATEQVELLSSNPMLHFDLGGGLPGEWTTGIGLIESVHTESVMRAGSAIPLTLFAITHIFVSAWIDQQCPAIADQRQAQGIGVAMARTVGSGVNNDLLTSLGICHQIQTAIPHCRRIETRCGALQRFELPESVRAQQQQRLFPHRPG